MTFFCITKLTFFMFFDVWAQHEKSLYDRKSGFFCWKGLEFCYWVLDLGLLFKQSSGLISTNNEPRISLRCCLGKGSAIVINGHNLAFHRSCAHCSMCMKEIAVSELGTNVSVHGSRLHCEACDSKINRGHIFKP